MSAVTLFKNAKKYSLVTCIHLEIRTKKIDAAKLGLETKVSKEKKSHLLCLHTHLKVPISLGDLISISTSPSYCMLARSISRFP